jgi:type VI secretion system protein ImpF
MAKISEDQQLVPSVLDRLLDEAPENPREPVKSRNQVLRELKQSVCRDLQDLLNTRWRCTEWPADLEDVEASLVNYGIPDFAGAHMGSQDSRDQLRRLVEQVIRKFEPRFKTVQVRLVGNTDPADRTLRLRIDALLYAEPAPEPVVFDSQLEPISGSFAVRGETR